MTSPHYPYWPQPQYPAAAQLPPVPAPKRRSPVDITITSVVFAIAVLAALGSLWLSLLFAMATDSCEAQCNFGVLGAAYLVTWGGVSIAAIVAIVGTFVAVVRGKILWIWPTLGLALIVVSFVVGVTLADSVIRHS
jgi:hypothetical protein